MSECQNLAPSEFRRRMCGEKKRYPTRKDAKRAREQIIQRFKNRMGVYRCPFCREYHLGHSTKYPRRDEGAGQPEPAAPAESSAES